MPAGKLRERVILYARAAGEASTGTGGDSEAGGGDGYGNSEGAWVEQFRCAAGRLFVKGREEVMAQRLQGTQPVVWTLRVSTPTLEITPDWRLRDARSGVDYNIRSVMPGARRNYLELLCEAGVADG